MTTTAIAKFDPKSLVELDTVAAECAMTLEKAGNNISGALAVAENMHRLRQLITPQMLDSVSALQGTPLGFKTDRTKAKSGPREYSPEELRDPFIEATVRGFRAIGNEFNIIAGNFYGAKAGFERKVRTFPGLTDFSAMYDVEEFSGGMAKIQCVATWVIDGQPDEFIRRKGNVKGQVFDNRIRVRINEGMGHDAVIGKAQRKFYAAIYDYLIGAETATPEGDPDDLPLGLPDANKRVRRSDIFDAPTSEPEIDESQQSASVNAYRVRLSAIGAKSEVSGIAREAGKDSTLTPGAKAQIMAACSEAMKIWPNRIAAVANTEAINANSQPSEDESITVSQWCEEVIQLNTVKECDAALETVPKNISEAGRKKCLATLDLRKATISGPKQGKNSGELFNA